MWEIPDFYADHNTPDFLKEPEQAEVRSFEVIRVREETRQAIQDYLNETWDEEDLETIVSQKRVIEHINYLIQKATQDRKIKTMSQLLELKRYINANSHQNTYDSSHRIDHFINPESLPENIFMNFYNASIYHKWPGDDYYKPAESLEISNNLSNGIHQGETWEISIRFGRIDHGKYNSYNYTTRIKVTYQWENLIFHYNGSTEYIPVDTRLKKSPLRVQLGSKLSHHQKKAWKRWDSLEFYVQWNWSNTQR